MDRKTVSFDFDLTLSREDVQEYALELIQKGVDVYVCTFRLSDEYQKQTKILYSNDDLFKVTDKLGISRDKIIFTNMEDKSKFLPNNCIWHLDDDYMVISDLKHNTKIPCINVNSSSYKIKCNRLLDEKKNKT